MGILSKEKYACIFVVIVAIHPKNSDKMSNLRLISRATSKLKILLQNNRTNVEIEILVQ